MSRTSPAKIVALRREDTPTNPFQRPHRRPPGDSRSVAARIVVSPRAAERLIRAVTSGVDEYILITTDGSLSLRIRVALDAHQADELRVANGKLVVDWPHATISSGRDRVSISRTELRLLGGLLEGNGDAVPRAQLIARAWPRDEISPSERENALAVYVCTLRKRLATIGLGHALQTVRGVGYRLELS